jgi:hypothetical protein
MYVEVVDSNFILRYVKTTNSNDVRDEEVQRNPSFGMITFCYEMTLSYQGWSTRIAKCKMGREVMRNLYNRAAPNEHGEMYLCFAQNDTALQPNHKALGLHKTACLIWRMAGGADSEDEECSDDESSASIYVADNRMTLEEKISFFVQSSVF